MPPESKFTPTEFISVVNQTLDYAYSSVLIEGEVASFKVNQGKWVFFDLKDAESSVSCFMTLYQLRTPLEDGMKIVVRGIPKLTKWGKFSFTVTAIKPVGEGSIKKAYDAVNAAFKYGVRSKQVPNNPAYGVSIPSKKLFEQKEIPCYTATEAAQLTSQALSKYKNGKRHYPMGAFVPFLLNTGLRLSEFLALKWEKDVDLEKKTITVHSNLVSVKDRSKEKGYKLLEQENVKTDAGQNRVIPLNDSAYEALLDLKTRTGEKEYVMMTETGKNVRPADLDQMFRRIAKASGVPEEN